MADLLIVDDDLALLEAMGEILTTYGHQVRVVTSGEAALDAIEVAPPDLIVTDVVMPGMSGLELWEAVRHHPDWENIPFVFISAVASPQTCKQIAELGSEVFLGKPFDAEMLQNAVAAGLGSHPFTRN